MFIKIQLKYYIDYGNMHINKNLIHVVYKYYIYIFFLF